MTGDELAAWLASVFPGMGLSLVHGTPVATAQLDGASVAVTLGLSTLDTGLRLDADPDVRVGCELVARGRAGGEEVAETVIAAANELAALGVPARPGVLLEFGGRRGLLREPELFAQGTPLYREPGQLTLLLELVLLTADEYEIASSQGVDVLATRLRRRGVEVADWARE